MLRLGHTERETPNERQDTMASRKQTTAERFGIEKRVFAAKICYCDIEDNGKQAGATVDYKSLAAAYKRCSKDIANGLALSLHALTADGWVECGA
nr:MAG TPA: hypothetical protein [Caudoviricetes sp.]